MNIIRCSKGTGEDMLHAFESKLIELEGENGIDFSTVASNEDIMLEEVTEEDFDNIDTDESSDEEVMYSNYEEFISNVNDTFEEPLEPEVVDDDITLIQDAIDNLAKEDELDNISIMDCPIFWKDSYTNPIIEINGNRYIIEYIEFNENERYVQLIREDELDEGVSEEVEDDFVEDEIVEESTEVKASSGSYDLQDIYDKLIMLGNSNEAIDLVLHIAGDTYEVYEQICEYLYSESVEDIMNEHL